MANGGIVAGDCCLSCTLRRVYVAVSGGGCFQGHMSVHSETENGSMPASQGSEKKEKKRNMGKELFGPVQAHEPHNPWQVCRAASAKPFVRLRRFPTGGRTSGSPSGKIYAPSPSPQPSIFLEYSYGLDASNRSGGSANGPLFFSIELKLPSEGVQPDPQKVRCLGLVSSRLLVDPEDVSLFHFPERSDRTRGFRDPMP